MDFETDICEICKAPLVSVNAGEIGPQMECAFCNKSFEPRIFCPNKHYICDGCHSKDAATITLEICEQSEEQEPFVLLDYLMSHPKVKMYGPDHHVIVPAVIITVLKNRQIQNQKGQVMGNKDIKEAIKRGSKVPGGWCGFFGSCGAGIGAGVALSVFTRATPSTAKSRSLANLATSHSLNRIADDLEHCCKRSSRIAIDVAFKLLEEKFAIPPISNAQPCPYKGLNSRCSGSLCPYF